MIRRTCSLLIVLLLFSLLPLSKTSARSSVTPPEVLSLQGENGSRVVTFSELGYPKDETYKGVLVGRDYSVRWPDAWEIQPGNMLKLVFSHSAVLHPKSSMVVDWNGSRLASVLLVKENTDRAVLEIPIPEDIIVTGYNRLHIEFFMGIDEDFCKDEDNPALWATVHSTSAITMSFSLKTPELDLGLYPLPLVDNSPLVDNNVTFILPPEATTTELNAAAVISAGLGKLAAWHMVSIQSQDTSEPLPDGDLVVIGRPDRMTLLATSGLPYLKAPGGQPSLQDASGNPLPEQTGVLWEEVSPVDPTGAILFVTGSSDEAVLTAARALASTTTISRLTGQTGLILSVPEPVQAGPGSLLSFTLEELGYPDMQARGTREQNIIYVLPLERAWQNESEVLLDLHFAHSNLLNSRRSSITIEVNGTSTGSIQLTPENAENGNATFHIPARLFKVGSNTLTVSANLRLPDDIEQDWDCLDNHTLESWIVVYSDSKITLPGETTGGAVSFEEFPSAFIGTNSLSDVAFIVPETFSSLLAAAVMRIAEGLGDASTGDNFFPHVLGSGSLADAAAQYPYLYLVGRPSQNPAITFFNDSLPLPFIQGTDEPQDVASVARLITGASSVGYLQAFPGLKGSPNLVVSGSSDEGILWAADVLQNPNRYKNLTGDVAIVDGPASITSAEVRYSSTSISPPEEEPGAETSGIFIAGQALQPTLWMMYAAGGVLLLALLIMIIFALVEIQHRQKERSHYGSHSA